MGRSTAGGDEVTEELVEEPMNEEIALGYEEAATFLQGFIDRKDVREQDVAGWKAAILELRFKAVRIKANDPES
jgi:hypothetical protein